jgi:hypothetical protein
MIIVDFNIPKGERELVYCKAIRKVTGFRYLEVKVESSIQDFLELSGSLYGFKTKNTNKCEPVIDLNTFSETENIELWFDPNSISYSKDKSVDDKELCVVLFLHNSNYMDSNSQPKELEDHSRIKLIYSDAIFKSFEIDQDITEIAHSLERKKIATTKFIFCKPITAKEPQFTIGFSENQNGLFLLSENPSLSIHGDQYVYSYNVYADMRKIENPQFNSATYNSLLELRINDKTIHEKINFEVMRYLPVWSGYNFIANDIYESGITFRNNKKILIGELAFSFTTNPNSTPAQFTWSFAEDSPFSSDDNSLTIDHNHNSHTVNVYADTSKIANPIEQIKNYSLVLSGSIGENSSGAIPIHNTDFQVFRNNSKTEFDIKMYNLYTKSEIRSDSSKIEFGDIECRQQRFLTAIGLIRIEIKNSCDLQSSGHLVFTKPFITGNHKGVIVVEPVEQQSEFESIPNGDNRVKRYDVLLDLQAAQAFLSNKIEFGISIHYFEDDNNNFDPTHPAAHLIEYPAPKMSLTLAAPRCRSWVCVDNGTSAVVAMKREGGEDEVINLNRIQKNLLISESKGDYRQYEENSRFITSMLMFKPGGKLNSNTIMDSFYRFSPTEDEAIGNTQFISPPMKSIIGHNEIYNKWLNINDRNQIIQYTNEDGEQITADDIVLSPSKAIEKSYDQLLNYYMPEGEYNVVFTYPNKLSRFHVNQLRKNYRTRFPNTELLDISESDAALLSYITSGHFEIRPNSETYILIYDMGAGTLDISYAKVTINKDLSRTVDVLGKTGSNTGGNYLDYIIAKILCLGNKTREDLYLRKSGVESFALKNKIADIIKPALSNFPENVDNIDVKGVQIEYDCSSILNSDLVREYILECTEGIITDFKSYLPNKLDRVDKVVFTGRASQFKPIINKLKIILNVNDTQIVQFDDPQQAKEIVANGAIKYAALFARGNAIKFHNRNLYSSFGIIYQDEFEKEKYLPLLHPIQNKHKDSVHDNNLTIFQYEEKFENINFSHSSKITLVQSFSAKPLEDYQKGRENVMILNEIDNTGPIYTIVDLTIELDAKNSLVLYIGSDRSKISEEYTAISNNGEIFKGMMWPYWTN